MKTLNLQLTHGVHFMLADGFLEIPNALATPVFGFPASSMANTESSRGDRLCPLQLAVNILSPQRTS